MARRLVQANGREYLFSPDDQPLPSSQWWGLLRLRLINDVTGRPVGGQIKIESDLDITVPRMGQNGVVGFVKIPLAVPRIASDGLVGLVAVPQEVFPILAGKNYTLNLTIHAAGYLSRPKHPVVIPSVQTAIPGPKAGDHVIKLNKTDDLQVGEWLMIGNLSTISGGKFEAVQIVAIATGTNQVTINPKLKMDHITGSEPVVQLTTNVGDVTLVPQP